MLFIIKSKTIVDNDFIIFMLAIKRYTYFYSNLQLNSAND
jgi:hypothetical protein